LVGVVSASPVALVLGLLGSSRGDFVRALFEWRRIAREGRKRKDRFGARGRKGRKRSRKGRTVSDVTRTGEREEKKDGRGTTNPALPTNDDTAETKSRLRNRRQAAVQGPLLRRDTGGEGAVMN
jgi:hypothetical protein